MIGFLRQTRQTGSHLYRVNLISPCSATGSCHGSLCPFASKATDVVEEVRPSDGNAGSDEALDSFYESHLHRVKASIARYNAAERLGISEYRQRLQDAFSQKRGHLAGGILSKMRLEGVRPTQEAYRDAIFAVCQRPRQDVGQAMDILRDMERHGCPINDQVYAAIISAAAYSSQFDFLREMIIDLKRWRLADSHRIRKAIILSVSLQGKTEECLELLDESVAKKDPYIIRLFQQAMLAAEKKALKQKIRDKDAVLAYISRIINDAEQWFDLNAHPEDRDQLFMTAVRVLDKVGYHTELPRFYDEIEVPTINQKQSLFLSHIKLAFVDLPGGHQVDRKSHHEAAMHLLNEFKQNRVLLRPETLHAVLLALLKSASKTDDNDSALQCCEQFIDFLHYTGRYLLKIHARNILRLAERQKRKSILSGLQKLIKF